jgi:DNA polymerase-3 subunit delta
VSSAPRAFLIAGDDPYLRGEALNEVLSGVAAVSIDEFGPGDEVERILQALATTPMFEDRRVVVVRDAEQLSADAVRQLTSYLNAPNEAALLVLVSEKPQSKLAAAVRKVGGVIEVGRGTRSDLFSWLRQQVKGRDLKASGDAMSALVEAVGDERLALAQALDELRLALASGAKIGPDEIRRQFQGRADARVFALVDAVANRNAGEALVALHRLLRQGEAPQALFWTLARQFRLLLLAHESAPGKVATALGVPMWRAEKLARQASQFTKSDLTEAYRTLAAADHKMKLSEEPEALTLERVVVAISKVGEAAIRP